MNRFRLPAIAPGICPGRQRLQLGVDGHARRPDRRQSGHTTIGSKIDDSLIETKAAVNIAKAHPTSTSVATSWLPATTASCCWPGRRLAKNSSRWQNRQPAACNASSAYTMSYRFCSPRPHWHAVTTWLTTKIKTQMLADNSVPGSRIKVITENGSSIC